MHMEASDLQLQSQKPRARSSVPPRGKQSVSLVSLVCTCTPRSPGPGPSLCLRLVTTVRVSKVLLAEGLPLVLLLAGPLLIGQSRDGPQVCGLRPPQAENTLPVLLIAAGFPSLTPGISATLGCPCSFCDPQGSQNHTVPLGLCPSSPPECLSGRDVPPWSTLKR